MKKISVGQVRDNLAEYLGQVHHTGETIVVCKYDNPWVEIHPVTKTRTSEKTGIDALTGTWTKKEAELFNKRIEEMFEKIDLQLKNRYIISYIPLLYRKTSR
ncbi:MAG: hypothetical protein US54_C0066G0003 [Candidatus Roizmanbacteria bacterium GW2011_GWA2_37_7]|uniref:Antitoxin n=1 Tax=Candidatus Roizmanbacteria bacterium GW2011_GWA2_37_7 TaxID=1618481 RepID=A0A0G0JI52_9BACT|nr:MAG: hypothetical protein US54_C0066G0003 [Candidatus Roizmanbacteria bacterium GW2011_GWA2_37_7]